MEKYEFETSNLFEFFFGYRAFPYPEIILKRLLPDKSIEIPERYAFKNGSLALKEYLISHKGVKYYAKNSLGNLMYMPITLTRVGSSGVVLENTVISMTCEKTIIETPLVNRRGTVKEEISINDWIVDVKGIVIGEKDYPETEVERLKELFNESQALKINNVLTSIFLDGQEKVVIKSLKIEDNRGMECRY